MTDPAVKALTKALAKALVKKLLRLLLKLSPLSLKKRVEDIVIQMDFKRERKTRGWWTYSVNM